MAEKRMFSRKITESDDFTDMPGTAQALYFHLNQGADDDGFNNQVKHAMLYAHASPDDLKMLLAKNFILRFQSGVIVIKHWWMHNTLRKDRYTPTNFQEELALLGVKDNKSYTISDKVQVIESDDGNQMATNWQPNDNHLVPQIREEEKREEKIRLDISPSNDGATDTAKTASSSSTSLTKTQQSRFDAFWKVYPKKVGKQDAQKAWKKIAPDEELTDTIIRAVETAKQKDSRFREERFIPHPATWLNAGSWENEYDDYFPAQEQPKQAERHAQAPKPQSEDSLRQLDVDGFLAAATRRRRT